LITNQFDPKIPTSLTSPGIGSGTSVYTDARDYGSLITRVTVVSTGLVGDRVITKVIYLGIEDKDKDKFWFLIESFLKKLKRDYADFI
jgi:hypothetical protein